MTTTTVTTIRLPYGPDAHTFGWAWIPTGRTRRVQVPSLYCEKWVRQYEYKGVEYVLTAEPPADGGTVPTGRFGDAEPTGRTKLVWD